jgi:hypothetical protein
VGALIAEVSAAFVPSPCGIQGTVMSQDIKGDHFELMKDVNEDVKDFIVEGLSQSEPEV